MGAAIRGKVGPCMGWELILKEPGRLGSVESSERVHLYYIVTSVSLVVLLLSK